jgi:Ni/Fe-hydrogenase subunit HybB-like protein
MSPVIVISTMGVILSANYFNEVWHTLVAQPHFLFFAGV